MLWAAVFAGFWKFISWFMDESGRLEAKKREVLREKKAECRQALRDGRWDDLKRLTDELQRLSSEA
jgi:hypothetical protein